MAAMTPEELQAMLEQHQALSSGLQPGGDPASVNAPPESAPPMQTTPTNKGFSAISRGPLAFASGMSDGAFGENANRSPSEDMNIKARGNEIGRAHV